MRLAGNSPMRSSDWSIRGDSKLRGNCSSQTDALRNSERCIEAMALAALRAGQQQYAVACLNRLEEISDDRSTWGWWFYGDAKLRIHRLRVNLHGTPARSDALRVFLDDLANGREELASLLPNLADTFEVISNEVLWGQPLGAS